MAKERVDEWIGGQGMPGSRLVRMERGEKTQSFNICRSLNTLGDYQDTYVIGHPDPFMSNGEFIRCRSVEELVDKILRYHGKRRELRHPPNSNSAGIP